MTIYGPSSLPYDEALGPILMTDWNHRSAFEDWAWSLQPLGTRPKMTNILLNGKGRYRGSSSDRPIGQPKRYRKTLQRGHRCLLRLSNRGRYFTVDYEQHRFSVLDATEMRAFSKIVINRDKSETTQIGLS